MKRDERYIREIFMKVKNVRLVAGKHDFIYYGGHLLFFFFIVSITFFIVSR